MRYYSEKEDTPESCLSLMRGINIPDKYVRIVDLDKTLDWLTNKKRAFSMAMTAKIINALKDAPVLVKETEAEMDNFKELVADMRKAQRGYFKTKDANMFIKSKELERKVDEELEKYEDLKHGEYLL